MSCFSHLFSTKTTDVYVGLKSMILVSIFHLEAFFHKMVIKTYFGCTLKFLGDSHSIHNHRSWNWNVSQSYFDSLIFHSILDPTRHLLLLLQDNWWILFDPHNLNRNKLTFKMIFVILFQYHMETIVEAIGKEMFVCSFASVQMSYEAVYVHFVFRDVGTLDRGWIWNHVNNVVIKNSGKFIIKYTSNFFLCNFTKITEGSKQINKLTTITFA